MCGNSCSNREGIFANRTIYGTTVFDCWFSNNIIIFIWFSLLWKWRAVGRLDQTWQNSIFRVFSKHFFSLCKNIPFQPSKPIWLGSFYPSPAPSWQPWLRAYCDDDKRRNNNKIWFSVVYTDSLCQCQKKNPILVPLVCHLVESPANAIIVRAIFYLLAICLVALPFSTSSRDEKSSRTNQISRRALIMVSSALSAHSLRRNHYFYEEMDVYASAVAACSQCTCTTPCKKGTRMLFQCA